MAVTRGWDDCDKKASESGGGGMFIRLDDGQSVVGAFCGAPVAKEIVWNAGKSEDYDPDKHGNGAKPKLRVSVNFFVPANGMKVFEMSSTTYRQVVKMRSKYGLDAQLFEISREGTGLDTVYTVLPDEKVNAELAALIAAATLNNLESDKADDEDAGALPGEAVDDDDGPIDSTMKAQIVGRLKQLPKAALKKWLEELKVKAVKDLTQGQTPQAFTVLEQLEGAGVEAEADPFA